MDIGDRSREVLDYDGSTLGHQETTTQVGDIYLSNNDGQDAQLKPVGLEDTEVQSRTKVTRTW